ncbi:MAG: tRNA (adenosine(37)-N6)-dimethylallyltransferase MiaA, partial [Bdellovibrionota bacterium]
DAYGRLEKTIGYGECLQLLDGKINKAQAIELTTAHTRQYAKRQDTWFRKNPSIIWYQLDQAADNFSFSIENLTRV